MNEDNSSKGKDTDDGESQAPATDVDRWNIQALDGGKARQNKFLRLMGGKKAGVVETSASSSRKDNKKIAEIKQREEELEKQFNSGMRAKHSSGNGKKGLGS